MIERVQKAEQVAERLLELADQEPHSIFDGEIVDRRCLRQTLDDSPAVPLHRLCELVMKVLVERTKHRADTGFLCMCRQRDEQ